MINVAFGSLLSHSSLGDPIDWGGGARDVINVAFGSLSGHSSLGDLIDWGGGTGDVINVDFGSLSGHSSFGDPTDGGRHRRCDKCCFWEPLRPHFPL